MKKSDSNKLVIFILLLNLCSCTESPLSDVEINDPSVLHVSTHIYQDFDNNRELIVEIKDKNGHYIDLRNGEVLINDQRAEFKSNNMGVLGKSYVLKPGFEDTEFRILIQYNSRDSYFFIIGRNYFPGFKTDRYIQDRRLCHSANKLNGEATLYNTPFYQNKIKFNFDIMKKESDMVFK